MHYSLACTSSCGECSGVNCENSAYSLQDDDMDDSDDEE